jgi:ribonuclease P protein component
MAGMAMAGHRYPSAARLRRPVEFKSVLNESRRLRSGVFELRFHHNESLSARLGLVIPKKLARQAVLRNLVRRLARESFRLRLISLPPVDVVIRLAKPICLEPGRARLSQRKAWRADVDALLANLAT